MKHAASRALRLFRQGKFDLAAQVASQEKREGRESASLVLGLEALSRRAIDSSSSYLEPLLAQPVIGRKAARFFWIAARLSRDVAAMRRAADLLVAHKAVNRAAVLYLRQIPESCRSVLRVEGEAARLPFLNDYPLPAIEARINGRTANLLIDNGASELVLSQNLAQHLHIASAPGSLGHFAGATTAQVRRAFVDQVTLGALKIHGVPAAVFERLGQIDGGARIDGILGSDILGRFRVAWDFPNASLELNARPAPPASGWSPVRVLGSHILVMEAALSEVVRGLFFLDAGGTFGVALDRRGWRSLLGTARYDVTPLAGVAGAGSEIPYLQLRGPEFRIGAAEIPNVTVVGGVFPERLKRDVMVDLRGIFSFEVLQWFARVEIDFPNCRIAMIERQEASLPI
jgi:hypothetical protein